MAKSLCLSLTLVLLAGCVVPDFYGPNFSVKPTEGMTRDQLRAHWGVP